MADFIDEAVDEEEEENFVPIKEIATKSKSKKQKEKKDDRSMEKEKEKSIEIPVLKGMRR